MKTKQSKAKTLSMYSFMEMFPNDDKAREFIEKNLWEDKRVCPYCKSTKTYPRKNRGGYRCGDCKKDFTIRTGTIFENSRLSLHKWLYAMYLIVTARKGISSLQLSKELDITQKTAWFLLQRIREACNNGSILLSGIIEADETYLGGKEKNKHESKKLKSGRGAVGKTAVFGMRERDGKVKATVISDTQAGTIKKEIKKTVIENSILCTDEHKSYKGLKKDYIHLSVNHSAKEFVNGMAHTNSIESVWAVLKRGYYGTFHHFSLKHTQRYIDEFSFRLNEGNCKIDTLDRIKSLIKGFQNKRLTYSELKG